MKNNRLNYIFTVGLILVTLYILSSNSEVRILPHLLESTSKLYLTAGLLCMVLYWLFDVLIFQSLFSLNGLNQKFFHYLRLTLVGQYYNLVTPFSSGGQPAQIYMMSNEYKITYGQATSITINKFMVYHVVVTLFSLVMAVIQYPLLIQQALWAKTFILVGLVLNTFGTVIIFAVCYNRVVFRPLILYFFRMLKRLQIIKEVPHKTIDSHIQEYRASLFLFLANKTNMFIVSLHTLLQIVAFYSVTYFVYLSFSLTGSSYLEILAIQSLLYIAVKLIPTPGNAGVSEGGFYFLFSIVFPASVLLSSVVLWRLITYYFNLVVTGSVVLAGYIAKKIKKPIPLS